MKRANPWNPVNLHTFPHQPCDAGHLSLDCDPSSPAACQRRRADDLAAAKGIRNEKDPAGTGFSVCRTRNDSIPVVSTAAQTQAAVSSATRSGERPSCNLR